MAGFISDLPLRPAYPADQETVIREKTATALSATEVPTAIAFIQKYDLLVVINAAAYSGYDAGTAQWTITVEASADNSTFVVLRSFVLDGTAQRFDTAISQQEMLPYSYIRTKATKTGTPGTLSYGSFIPGC
jgi:hypothetical protein